MNVYKMLLSCYYEKFVFQRSRGRKSEKFSLDANHDSALQRYNINWFVLIILVKKHFLILTQKCLL